MLVAPDLDAGNPATKMMDLRTGWVAAAMITCLVLMIYWNSLQNDFVNWDDPGLIIRNQKIRSLDFKNILEIFTPKKSSTFQPIRVLSYAIDYRIWKFNPIGYHITNLLFYILACIMVFFSLFVLSTNLRKGVSESSHQRAAFFGSLLYAAHPVHVEAVTWLSARKEVLHGFFFFLAFYLYLRGKKEGGRKKVILLGLVLLVFFLAILSKPSAVVFPAVILIYEFAFRKDGWSDFVRRHWFFLLLSILISLIFVIILMKVMLEAGGIKPYRGGTFLSNLLASAYIFTNNIKLLAFTINYSAAYTLRVFYSVLSLQTLLVVCVTSLLFGLSVWSLKKTKIFFFSFFFLFVTLLPYLNIVPISTLLADRYLFIPSFSFCFLLGIGFDKLYELTYKRFSEGFFKLLSVVIFLFLLGGYSFITFQQNKVWENSYTLWSDAVAKYPESNEANALIGVVYMELGMDEEAVEYLEKAVQILPIDYESRNNLGIVYQRLEMAEKALNELLISIALKPENDLTKINLSVFYQRQKEYKKSEEILKHLISKKPQDASLYFRLGVLYKDMGHYEAAVSELIKANQLAPEIINPYEELGNIYISKIGDREKGVYYYKKGIESALKAKLAVDDLRWMVQDLECYK